MKHLALIFCILMLLPACALGEKILWEDDTGQVVLNDDGGVNFLSGSDDGEELDENKLFAAQTPSPEPLYSPTPTPTAFTFSKTVKFLKDCFQWTTVTSEI